MLADTKHLPTHLLSIYCVRHSPEGLKTKMTDTQSLFQIRPCESMPLRESHALDSEFLIILNTMGLQDD